MSAITLNEVREKLEFIQRMYDAVRIVDPVKKCVLDYEHSRLAETPEACYKYWESGNICDNCISIRAHWDNKSYIKLERSPEAVMMVTATPIENTERPMVLELLKNATDTLYVGKGDYPLGEPFTHFSRELNDLIVKDTGTGLYNRRFVNERLPVDLVRAALNDQPLSVCFFDLDNLKFINDRCGHTVGDIAIQQTSEVILKHIRADQDWAARYGGDEFVICLINTDAEEAANVAQRIQDRIEGIAVECEGGTQPLAVSFGIETMADTPMTAEEIICGADRNMYAAKRARNE